eukprot:10790.XXX_417320_413844_1 [CDS] Oithona nana genome sequencing.
MVFVFHTTFMNGINYYAQVFMFVTPPHDDCIGSGFVRYKYNFSSIFPTLTSENNWVCEDDDMPNYVEMVFWCGNIAGFLLWGYTNDRFGRRPTILISHVVYIMGNAMTFVLTNFWPLLLCRFLVGAAHMTISHLPYMLVLEYCSEKDRIIPLWTVMLSYSLSSILTPVMSMYLSSWRALLAMATLPNFLVILADFFGLIPESLRWLLCKGRKENALKLVHKIAKFNRVQLNEKKLQVIQNLIDVNAAGASNNNKEETAPESKKSAGLLQKLRTNIKFSLRATLTLLLCFVVYTCYYGLVGNTANIGNENIFLPYIYGATMEMAVVFSIPFLLNKMGRRWTLITMLLAATVASFVFVFSPSDWPDYLNMILAVTSRVCAAGSYYACLQFASELFPTEIRGKGSSAFEISGGIGLFIQPQINYLAKSYHPSIPIVIYGGLCLMAMVFGFLLPETAGEEMPQTIEEANGFGSNQSYLNCIICRSNQKDLQLQNA